MHTTVNMLLSEIMRRSKTVWGMHPARLANKAVREPDEPDYEHGENDIHRLYRYIRNITAYGVPELSAVRNYSEPFSLQTLTLRRNGSVLELYSRAHRVCLNDFAMRQSRFPFAESSAPELETAFAVMDMIQAEYFWSAGFCHAALPGYIAMLASEQMAYEPECFRNIYLIDVSESPRDAEAITHFDLRVQEGKVQFIFRDTGETLAEAYRRLCGLPEYRQWARYGFRKFPAEKRRAYRNLPEEAVLAFEHDFAQILAHF